LRYSKRLARFKALAPSHQKKKIRISPRLHDEVNTCGSYKNEYFIMDLFISQYVYSNHPGVAVLDIGSRVDGLVSHMATFTKVNIVDIRQMDIIIPNISSYIIDLSLPLRTNELSKFQVITSCHALEHFGLGRYGDHIDPNGHEKALASINQFVSLESQFILCVPFGPLDVIYYDCHRSLTIESWKDLLIKSNFLIVDIFVTDGKSWPQNIDKIHECPIRGAVTFITKKC